MAKEAYQVEKGRGKPLRKPPPSTDCLSCGRRIPAGKAVCPDCRQTLKGRHMHEEPKRLIEQAQRERAGAQTLERLMRNDALHAAEGYAFELRRKDPTLSKEAALSKAFAEHPDLYAKYVGVK